MRYFFISYSHKNDSGFGYGNCQCISESFPSLSDIQIDIKRQSEQSDQFEGMVICILNIQELNEEDYNSLIGKGE